MEFFETKNNRFVKVWLKQTEKFQVCLISTIMMKQRCSKSILLFN